jgi:hypothetical protein
MWVGETHRQKAARFAFVEPEPENAKLKRPRAAAVDLADRGPRLARVEKLSCV